MRCWCSIQQPTQGREILAREDHSTTSSPYPSGQEPYGSGDGVDTQAGASQDSYFPSSTEQPDAYAYGTSQDPYTQGAYAGDAQQGSGFQQPYQGQAYQQSYQQPYQGQAYQQPYQQAYPGGYVQPGVAQKSKIAAGLLAILIGTLGVHNFYLGHTGRGVAQLLITVLSLGFLSWVSWIWAIVEGILILSAQPGQQPWGVDANGYPLQA